MNIDRAKMGINSHAVREISALIIIVVALFGALLYWFWGTPPLVDEYDHALQIENFVKGRFELNPSLAMGPGYHVVMAAIAKICGRSDLDMLRLYTTFLSIVCVYAFYITSVQTGNGSHLIRTVQFMALPVIFPYFSLVYSDIFSLLNVLLCYCWQLKKRYVVAGIFAFIAVIARQPSIIWIVMFFAMDYYADNGTKLSVTNILDSLKKNWSYSLLMLLFVLFVIINRDRKSVV